MLKSPSWGNPYRILSKQYIASELNNLSNENDFPSSIKNDLYQAKLLLMNNNPSNLPFNEWKNAINLASNLNTFNNGQYDEINWPHCDDQNQIFTISDIISYFTMQILLRL